MATSARAKAEELERLLAGGSVPDEAPTELRRLALLATAVTETTSTPTPTAQFRAELRERLLDEHLQAAPTLTQRIRSRVDETTARWKYSARAAVASALASTLIGTTGVAVAAQSALPGDFLYGMKRGTEVVRLAFAATDVEAGRLHLAFARERLDEIDASVARRTSTDLGPVFADMDEASVAGANHILQAAAFGSTVELTEELAAFTTQQRTRLTALFDVVPASMRPVIERSLEVLRRIDTQAGFALDPSCLLCFDEASTTAGVPVAPRVMLPGEGPAATSSNSCDCAGDDPAPAPRDPEAGGNDQSGSQDGSSSNDDPDGSTTDDTATGQDPGAEDEGTDLVPSLPGPLDDTGDAVDDTVDEVGDLTGTDDEISEVESIVDELLDPVEDPVEDLLPSEDPTGSLLP